MSLCSSLLSRSFTLTHIVAVRIKTVDLRSIFIRTRSAWITFVEANRLVEYVELGRHTPGLVLHFILKDKLRAKALATAFLSLRRNGVQLLAICAEFKMQVIDCSIKPLVIMRRPSCGKQLLTTAGIATRSETPSKYSRPGSMPPGITNSLSISITSKQLQRELLNGTSIGYLHSGMIPITVTELIDDQHYY